MTLEALAQSLPKKADVLNIHSRMDKQDAMLQEIRDMVVAHIAEEQGQQKVDGPVAKALDEIVLLWRASKILIPVLVAISVGMWAFVGWWKEHLK